MRFPQMLRTAAPVALLSGALLLAGGPAAAQQQQQQQQQQPGFAYSAGYDNTLRQGRTAPAAMPAQDVLETVFFDFDSAQVRPDARRTLEELARRIAQTDVVQVNVVGHTDTAGPADYNMRLSQRRAEAVSQVLTGLGVSNQVIDLAWMGQREPAVPTGDGVPEQRNRRVEVTVPAGEGFRAAEAR